MADWKHDPTIYWLDHASHIVGVDGPWDRFALENEGEAACAERVIGQPLLHFVSGDEARMWIDTLLQLARLTGEVLERSYRCDSPELQRFMNMRLVPEDSGMMRVEHHLVSVRQRIRPVRFLPVSSYQATLRLRCSICGRIKEQGEWMEAEQLSDNGPAISPIKVAYTVCQWCCEK